MILKESGSCGGGGESSDKGLQQDSDVGDDDTEEYDDVDLVQCACPAIEKDYQFESCDDRHDGDDDDDDDNGDDEGDVDDDDDDDVIDLVPGQQQSIPCW